MAASHPEMFKPSSVDESELLVLVEKHLLPNRVMIQWRPVKEEEIPTCEFLYGLLHYYQIELVHLNPNSILQIAVFIHLCEAFLTIHPSFPLLKHYFFLKYQPSVPNQKVIGSVGIQTLPRSDFIDLPMKTSLKGWHKS
jgi:hypothetical protein